MSSPHLLRAKKALEDNQLLLNDVAHARRGKGKDEEQKRFRKILGGIQELIGALEGVAELHGMAKAAVTLVKAIVQLEVDRKENSEHIVAVYQTMTNMLSPLCYLSEGFSDQHRLKAQVEEVIDRMVHDIGKFGAFADMYYTKCASGIVRFFRASNFKAKLQHLSKSFGDHQSGLVAVMSVATTVDSATMQSTMDSILKITTSILARLGVPQTKEEVAARALMERLSATHDVEKNSESVTKIAMALAAGKSDAESCDIVTPNTLEILKTDVDALIDLNKKSFAIKLEHAVQAIGSQIAQAKHDILAQMDKGAHRKVEDKSIQAMWEENKWGTAVDARFFADGLYTHFDSQLRSGVVDGPHLAWAVEVLRALTARRLICEFIDHDASGIITTQEVNLFLQRKPEQCSMEAWFAFWAMGWLSINIQYTRDILSRLSSVTGQAGALKAKFLQKQGVIQCIEAYLATVAEVRLILTWVEHEDGSNEARHFLDDADIASRDLSESIARSLAAEITQEMTTKLEQLSLDDSALLPWFFGHSSLRIEQESRTRGRPSVILTFAQVFILLLFTITHKHEGILANMVSNNASADDVWKAVETMNSTLYTLLHAWQERIDSLIYSWHVRDLEPEEQISRYAGGLFCGWYTKKMSRGYNLEAIRDAHAGKRKHSGFFGAMHGRRDSGDMLVKRMESIDTRMQGIEATLKTIHSSKASDDARMDGIDARMRAIEVMLEQLLHAQASDDARTFKNGSSTAGGDSDSTLHMYPPESSAPPSARNHLHWPKTLFTAVTDSPEDPLQKDSFMRHAHNRRVWFHGPHEGDSKAQDKAPTQMVAGMAAMFTLGVVASPQT